jgi:hypothetical protein
LLSAETVHLSIKNGYSDYSQTQWSVGLGRTSSEGFDLHARQIGISSDNTNYQGIAITNIGASQSWTSSQTSLGLDLYYSSYPNSTLGKLTAFEAALTGTQTFISDAKGGSFWGSIELESVMPTATVTQDPDSDFSLKSSYFRAALALNYFDLTNTYTAQYWAGSEAFGVRSGGAVVYSGNEEHTSGLSLKVSHAFDQTWSLQGSVGQENYKIGSTNASATVVTLAALIGI